MKLYIISQVLFAFLLGTLAALAVFCKHSKAVGKVLNGSFLVLFLAMGAVQGYLQGLYGIKDSTASLIFVLFGVALLIIVVIMNLIKRYVDK